MIQNHLLQVVGFLAMEPPASTTAEAIRDEQVKVFRPIRAARRPDDVVRGQFRGYRERARRRARLHGRDLRRRAAAHRLLALGGVPFFIRAGKCLPRHGDRGAGRRSSAPPLSELLPGEAQLRALPAGPRGGDRASARASKRPGDDDGRRGRSS